jgi:hypothetical protein
MREWPFWNKRLPCGLHKLHKTKNDSPARMTPTATTVDSAPTTVSCNPTVQLATEYWCALKTKGKNRKSPELLKERPEATAPNHETPRLQEQSTHVCVPVANGRTAAGVIFETLSCSPSRLRHERYQLTWGHARLGVGTRGRGRVRTQGLRGIRIQCRAVLLLRCGV